MITLRVTSAFWVGGEMAKPGELVDVSDAEARDLLSRGVADLPEVAASPPPPEPASLPKAAQKGSA